MATGKLCDCSPAAVFWYQTPHRGARSDYRRRTPMSAPDSDEVRTEALFVSDVQRSQQPTPELIREAVSDTVHRLGENGCAALVAQEFGEHPDSAVGRMLWARTAVQYAFQAA
jgi:hypothetical protein